MNKELKLLTYKVNPEQNYQIAVDNYVNDINYTIPQNDVFSDLYIKPKQIIKAEDQPIKTQITSEIPSTTPTVKARGRTSGKSVDQNVLRGLLNLLEDEGVSVNVTSWQRPNNKFKSGKKSHHIQGNAIDIVPGEGETWETLRQKLKGNKKLYDYFKANNLGIFDETDPKNLAKTGGTGPHWHIGPDKIAVAGLDAIILQKGGTLKNKLLDYIGFDYNNFKSRIDNIIPNKELTFESDFISPIIEPIKQDNTRVVEPKVIIPEEVTIAQNHHANRIKTTGDEAHDKKIKERLIPLKGFVDQLRNEGYSRHHIAGILGNLYAESGLNPEAVNSRSMALGLAQWFGPRKDKYLEFAKYQGKNHNDIDAQTQFLLNELNSNSAWLGKRRLFMDSKDIDNASDQFTLLFERPGKHEQKLEERRLWSKYIDDLLNEPQYMQFGGRINKYQNGTRKVPVQRSDNTRVYTQPVIFPKKLPRVIQGDGSIIKSDDRNQYQRQQDNEFTKQVRQQQYQNEQLYKHQHLWNIDPTRNITRKNVQYEFDNAKNLVKNSAQSALLATGLMQSVPKTVSSIIGGVSGEQIADKISDGNPMIKLLGGIGGGILGWKGMGNLQQYKVLPNVNSSATVINGTAYEKTIIPKTFKKIPGVPEKINYNQEGFYRVVGKDAITDIMKTGKIRGQKRYIEAYNNDQNVPQIDTSVLLRKQTTDKRIYHNPNSKTVGNRKLTEIAPNSEQYVYFGKGNPLPGHEASFFNSSKGPTNRTAPSEANRRLSRSYVIETPPETPMVTAGNLWRGLGKEPIKDWAKIPSDQHLSLYKGQISYNPETMNMYRLVDDKNQLFIRLKYLNK